MVGSEAKKHKQKQPSNKVLKLTLTPVPIAPFSLSSNDTKRLHSSESVSTRRKDQAPKGYTKVLTFASPSSEAAEVGYSKLKIPDVKALRKTPRKCVSAATSCSDIQVHPKCAKSEPSEHTGEASDFGSVHPVQRRILSDSDGEILRSKDFVVSMVTSTAGSETNGADQNSSSAGDSKIDCRSMTFGDAAKAAAHECRGEKSNNLAKESANGDSKSNNVPLKRQDSEQKRKPTLSFDKSKLSSAFKKLRDGSSEHESKTANSPISQEAVKLGEPQHSRDNCQELIPPDSAKPLEFDFPQPDKKKRKKEKKKKKHKHNSGDSENGGEIPSKKPRHHDHVLSASHNVSTAHPAAGDAKDKSSPLRGAAHPSKPTSGENSPATESIEIKLVKGSLVLDKGTVDRLSRATGGDNASTVMVTPSTAGGSNAEHYTSSTLPGKPPMDTKSSKPSPVAVVKRTARKTMQKNKRLAQEMEMVAKFKAQTENSHYENSIASTVDDNTSLILDTLSSVRVDKPTVPTNGASSHTTMAPSFCDPVVSTAAVNTRNKGVSVVGVAKSSAALTYASSTTAAQTSMKGPSTQPATGSKNNTLSTSVKRPSVPTPSASNLVTTPAIVEMSSTKSAPNGAIDTQKESTQTASSSNNATKTDVKISSAKDTSDSKCGTTASTKDKIPPDEASSNKVILGREAPLTTSDRQSVTDGSLIASSRSQTPERVHVLESKGAFESDDLNDMLSAAGFNAMENSCSQLSSAPTDTTRSEITVADTDTLEATKSFKVDEKHKWTKSLDSYTNKQKQEKFHRQSSDLRDTTAVSSATTVEEVEGDQATKCSQANLVIDTDCEQSRPLSADDLDESVFCTYEAPPSVHVVGPIIEPPLSVPPPSVAPCIEESSKELSEASIAISDVRSVEHQLEDEINIDDLNYVPHASTRRVGLYRFPNGTRVVTLYKEGELYCAAHELVVKLKIGLSNLPQIKCSPDEAALMRMMGRGNLKENFGFKMVPLSEVNKLVDVPQNSHHGKVSLGLAKLQHPTSKTKHALPNVPNSSSATALQSTANTSSITKTSVPSQTFVITVPTATVPSTVDRPSSVPAASLPAMSSPLNPSMSSISTSSVSMATETITTTATSKLTTLSESSECSSHGKHSHDIAILAHIFDTPSAVAAQDSAVLPKSSPIVTTASTTHPAHVSAVSSISTCQRTASSTVTNTVLSKECLANSSMPELAVISPTPTAKPLVTHVAELWSASNTITQNVMAIPLETAQPDAIKPVSMISTAVSSNVEDGVLLSTVDHCSVSSVIEKSLVVPATERASQPKSSSISISQDTRPIPVDTQGSSQRTSTSPDVIFIGETSLQPATEQNNQPDGRSATRPLSELEQVLSTSCTDTFENLVGEYKSLQHALTEFRLVKPIKVFHRKNLGHRTVLYAGELVPNLPVGDSSANKYATKTPFIVQCIVCKNAFSPLDFMLHLEEVDKVHKVRDSDLWVECIQLDPEIPLRLQSSEITFWNIFVDWFQMMSSKFNENLTNKGSSTGATRTRSLISVNTSTSSSTHSDGDSAATNISQFDEIPASPAPFKSSDVMTAIKDTSRTQPQPTAVWRKSAEPQQQTATRSKSLPGGTLTQQCPDQSAQQPAGQQPATNQSGAMWQVPPPPLQKASSHQQSVSQQLKRQMPPRPHLLAESLVQPQLQQLHHQQQQQHQRAHYHSQLQKQNLGRRDSSSPSSRQYPAQHLNQRPQLQPAQLQQAQAPPTPASMMSTFRIHPTPNTMVESYSRSAPSYHTSVAAQHQLSGHIHPQQAVADANSTGGGMNSPSGMSTSSAAVATDRFNMAMVKQRTSMLEVESAFRQLEEENALLRSQLSTERHEKQDYAIKLQKSLAELQARDQQIHAYRQEIQRLGILLRIGNH